MHSYLRKVFFKFFLLSEINCEKIRPDFDREVFMQQLIIIIIIIGLIIAAFWKCNI